MNSFDLDAYIMIFGSLLILVVVLFFSIPVDKLRRSMPNLVRAPSMPSVATPANQAAPLSLLRNSLSFDSSSAQFHSSSKKTVILSQPFKLANELMIPNLFLVRLLLTK